MKIIEEEKSMCIKNNNIYLIALKHRDLNNIFERIKN